MAATSAQSPLRLTISGEICALYDQRLPTPGAPQQAARPDQPSPQNIAEAVAEGDEDQTGERPWC